MYSTGEAENEDEEEEEDGPRKRRRTEGKVVPVKVRLGNSHWACCIDGI